MYQIYCGLCFLLLSFARPQNSKIFVDLNCGCFIEKDFEEKIVVDCSHRDNIDTDYVCLANRSLYNLNLSHKNLTEFPKDLLTNPGFKNLVILDISNNNIKQLHPDIASLYEQLHVNHNRLNSLPQLNGTKMKLLDVRYNNLTLPRWSLDDTNSVIETEGNPIKCECQNSTNFHITYTLVQKGKLPQYKCKDDDNAELKLFLENPKCEIQLNDSTNKPNFFKFDYTKIFLF